MEDAIVAMLNALSAVAGGATDDLLMSPEQYNSALYEAASTIHSAAVDVIYWIKACMYMHDIRVFNRPERTPP